MKLNYYIRLWTKFMSRKWDKFLMNNKNVISICSVLKMMVNLKVCHLELSIWYLGRG